MSPTTIASHLTPYLQDLREPSRADRSIVRAIGNGRLVVSNDGKDAKDSCTPIEMARRIASALTRRGHTRMAKRLRAYIKNNRAELEAAGESKQKESP